MEKVEKEFCGVDFWRICGWVECRTMEEGFFERERRLGEEKNEFGG